jgi:membrane-bound lytic murein transglycosylase MltF
MQRNSSNITTLYPRVLTICTYTEFAPFSYEINGKIVGSDINYLKSFANYLNLDVNIITKPFSKLWGAPGNNECDIAASGIMARKDRYIGYGAQWSNSYMEVIRSLLIRYEDINRFQIPSDFIHKKIVVTPDSTAHIDAIQRYQSIGAIILPFVPSQDEIVNQLMDNKIDAFAEGNISNKFLENAYRDKNEKKMLSLTDLHVMEPKETLNFIVRTYNNSLLDCLNKFIEINSY